jgi:predicted nucleic acid-binding protein
MNVSNLLYLDTSALLPYYREEAVSDTVQTLLMSLTAPALLTMLSRIEFASALARWVRMGELSEIHATDIEAAYQQDLEAGCFRVIPMTVRHYRQAERWLLSRKSSLRTLDALHLASAHAQGAQLVTCDSDLARSATQLGVEHRLLTP